jgi:hypothetical protein
VGPPGQVKLDTCKPIFMLSVPPVRSAVTVLADIRRLVVGVGP